MASEIKVGQRFRVTSIHTVESKNPDMIKYMGETGTVVLYLPPEWSLQCMYRMEMDKPGLEPKAFFGKELERV